MAKNILKRVTLIGMPVALAAAVATTVVMDTTEASRREVTIAGLEKRVYAECVDLWGNSGLMRQRETYQYQTAEGIKFEMGEKYDIGDRVMVTYYESGRVRAEKIAGVKK